MSLEVCECEVSECARSIYQRMNRESWQLQKQHINYLHLSIYSFSPDSIPNIIIRIIKNCRSLSKTSPWALIIFLMNVFGLKG